MSLILGLVLAAPTPIDRVPESEQEVQIVPYKTLKIDGVVLVITPQYKWSEEDNCWLVLTECLWWPDCGYCWYDEKTIRRNLNYAERRSQ